MEKNVIEVLYFIYINNIYTSKWKIKRKIKNYNFIIIYNNIFISLLEKLK